MEEGAGGGFAVVAGALGGGKQAVLLLAWEFREQARGGGADVVAFGVADEGGAPDLLGAALQGVLAQGEQVLDRVVDAVHELASPQRPAGRGPGLEYLQDPPEHDERGLLALAQAGRQRARDALEGRGEQVVRTAVGDARRDPALAARRPGGQVRAEAQADERDPGRVGAG